MRADGGALVKGVSALVDEPQGAPSTPPPPPVRTQQRDTLNQPAGAVASGLQPQSLRTRGLGAKLHVGMLR